MPAASMKWVLLPSLVRHGLFSTPANVAPKCFGFSYTPGILLPLQPVAVEHVDANLTYSVRPHEQVPTCYETKDAAWREGRTAGGVASRFSECDT
jgi:hypothetical protein